jgi:hypothetical protein
MATDSNYYVYAYFDPRDRTMMYVGKGQGRRKWAHLPNKAGTPMERQLHEIEQAGKEPLIRVIAVNLTEEQAFLVEKALIWRVGNWLTNASGGHFAKNFRPPYTFDEPLSGFDTEHGIFVVNVGHAEEHRHWEDCRKYGFLAAGYGRMYSSQLNRLEVGSIAAAYQPKSGYLGIARVTAKAVPSRDFQYHGRPLRPRMLAGPELLHDAEDDGKCEYLVAVEWIKHVPLKHAKFRKNAGLFTTRLIVASLSNHPKTRQYLEQQFKVNFERLLGAK